MNDTIPQWLARIEGRELDLYAMLNKIVTTMEEYWEVDPENDLEWMGEGRALLDEIGEKPDA